MCRPVFAVEGDVRADTQPLLFPSTRALGISDILHPMSVDLSQQKAFLPRRMVRTLKGENFLREWGQLVVGLTPSAVTFFSLNRRADKTQPLMLTVIFTDPFRNYLFRSIRTGWPENTPIHRSWAGVVERKY